MTTWHGSMAMVSMAIVSMTMVGCAEVAPELEGAEQSLITIGRYQVVTATGPLTTAADQQVIATCPKGTVALGGGHAGIESTGAYVAAYAQASAPLSSARWLVKGHFDQAAATPWRLRVRVLCGAAPAGFTWAVVDSALDATPSKQVAPACPAGQVGLGGGFAILDGGGGFLPGESTYAMPAWDGASWLVNGAAAPGTAAWKLRGYAICASAAALPGYQVVTVSSPLDSQPQQQVAPTCPAGTATTGGGWGVVDATGAILTGHGHELEPLYDGTGWLTTAENRSGFAPTWQLQGRAICLP